VGSVLFDAVFIPGGTASVEALKGEATAVHFVNEAYKHCKALAATGAGSDLLPIGSRADAGPGDGKRGQRAPEPGVVIGGDGQLGKVAEDFIAAIAQHRAWSREAKAQQIPA
jgi:catalase